MSIGNDKLLEVLQRYWGYDSFRPVQEEIIRSVCQGRDTLALMPTGGGKSLTYQVPTMLREGLCIVVTPLIALMKDQVDRLRRLGINAAAIHSGLSMRQIDIVLDNCVYGDVKFLYVAPERLVTEAFRLRVERMRVSLLAVDEAHCISQWGYDFRPSYLRIAELRERLPEVPVLALTASATPAVARDIMRQLRFAEPHVLRSSFARPNLSYAVRHDEDKNEQLLRVVRNVAGSGIVYVRTRDGCEQLTEFLRDAGVAATCYHGGLANAERSIRQEEWLAGRTRIMVAPNAFGMGIDKADVRFVVHYSMPDSLESYYQEAGRAGRDGKRAYAVLLVAPDDAERVQRRFDLQFPPLDEIRDIYEKVCSYLQIGIGDGEQASFVFNIHDFCAKFRLFGGKVASALKLLQQNGYLTLTDEMRNPARILFCISRDDLYKLRVVRNDLDHFIRTVLRLYDGVFTDFRPIDEQEIAAAEREYAEWAAQSDNDAPEYTGGAFYWPLPGYSTGSPMGWRTLNGVQEFHRGMDIPAPLGTKIYAAADGVVSTKAHYTYGTCVKLSHGGGLVTIYAHMSAWAEGIADGVPVKQGQLIGYVGRTGRAYGYHLHFEANLNGAPVDVRDYLG